MTREEIDILFEILHFYRDAADALNAECKLDTTMIVDTLARLRSGEYKIVENHDY